MECTGHWSESRSHATKPRRNESIIWHAANVGATTTVILRPATITTTTATNDVAAAATTFYDVARLTTAATNDDATTTATATDDVTTTTTTATTTDDAAAATTTYDVTTATATTTATDDVTAATDDAATTATTTDDVTEFAATTTATSHDVATATTNVITATTTDVITAAAAAAAANDVITAACAGWNDVAATHDVTAWTGDAAGSNDVRAWWVHDESACQSTTYDDASSQRHVTAITEPSRTSIRRRWSAVLWWAWPVWHGSTATSVPPAGLPAVSNATTASQLHDWRTRRTSTGSLPRWVSAGPYGPVWWLWTTDARTGQSAWWRHAADARTADASRIWWSTDGRRSGSYVIRRWTAHAVKWQWTESRCRWTDWTWRLDEARTTVGRANEWSDAISAAATAAWFATSDGTVRWLRTTAAAATTTTTTTAATTTSTTAATRTVLNRESVIVASKQWPVLEDIFCIVRMDRRRGSNASVELTLVWRFSALFVIRLVGEKPESRGQLQDNECGNL